MRVVRGRTDRDSFSRSALEIAKVMGNFLEIVCVELLVVLDLIKKDDIMGGFCLSRISRRFETAKKYLLFPAELCGRPCRSPSPFPS